MGEANRKRLKHALLRSGAYTCVYCGVQAAETVDHMPPRAAFDGSARPAGLVFPACRPCNRGSSSIDTIISWLSRIYPDAKTEAGRQDTQRLVNSVITNFPEVGSSLQRIYQPPLARLPSGLLVKNQQIALKFDRYAIAAMEHFGLKFALAMHWQQTGLVASENARISILSYTNYDDVKNKIPQELYELFPTIDPLKQGKFTSIGTFSYASRAERDGKISAHICAFRYSFMIMAIVDETPDIVADPFKSFTRSDFQRPYPYGLPRLSEEAIRNRFASINGPYRRR